LEDKDNYNYVCPNCGEQVDYKSYKENKCPKCRYRILLKKRSPVRPSKPIKAR